MPDWEKLTHWYLDALRDWDAGKPGAASRHGTAMHDLIDQMVRQDASGSAKASWVGKLENWYRGGAAGTGELHRWMYDRRSLAALLESLGFREPRVETARSSRVADWCPSVSISMTTAASTSRSPCTSRSSDRSPSHARLRR